MALKTADYKQMGFNAAKTQGKLAPCALKEGSWQLDAWSAGHAEGMKEVEVTARQHDAHRIMEQRRRDAFAHWPQAAAEHGKQLALSMAATADEKRCHRLLRSFNRMVKRYGPAQPTTN